MLFQHNFSKSEAEVAGGILAPKPGHSGHSRVGSKAQKVNQCHPYRIQRDGPTQLLHLGGIKSKVTTRTKRNNYVGVFTAESGGIRSFGLQIIPLIR